MVDRTSNLSGLRVPSSEMYSNQSGLGSISPGLDGATRRQQALDRIAGFGAEAAPQLRPPPGAAPQTRAVPQASSGAYYNPSLDRFSVGGVEFGREDYDIALQASSLAGQPAPPPTTPGYRPISTTMFNDYLSTISEGRGFLGNLGTGAQQAGGSILTGLGRGAEMAGFEGTGEALVGAGEVVGQSSAERARSAAIYSRQTPLQRLGTGVVQAVPSLVASVVPGVGAAGLAVRAGATAGGLAARGAAAAGASTTVLPMHIDGSWRAAAANPNLDTSDPEIQTEILMSALGKTAIDLLGQDFAIRGLSAGLRRIISDKAKRGGRLKRALGAGAAEGTAELLTEVVDQVVFDVDSRAALSEDDWAALWPIITEKYGEQNLLAFGVGAVLGGSLGALSPGPAVAPADAPRPVRDVDTGAPTDMLGGTVLEPSADADPAAAPLGLPAPEARLALPAPAAAPNQLSLPAPAVAGLLPPPALVTPAPTQPIAPPPPGARPLQPMPEDLAGPVAEGFQRAADAGPGYRPPMPPAQPTAPDFTVGAEPVQPIAVQRTDLPPGMQRLRQRPSERTETYAPTPAPAGETAMGEQLNRLLQQQQAQQEAAAAAAQAQQEAREAQATEDTQRLVDGAERWDEFNPSGFPPTFESLPPRVQDRWVDAVAQNQGPRGMSLQRFYMAIVAEAARRGPGDQQLRRQATEEPPIVTPAPEAAPKANRAKSPLEKRTLATGVYGTATGKPFKATNGAEMQRPSVAKLLGVKSEELRVIGYGDGFALAPIPPKPKKGKSNAIREQGAKESTLRQGPKAGGKVRSRDTKGQTPTGESTQETTQEDTTQEQPPVRKAEVKFGRGMTDAERMRLQLQETAAVNLKADRPPATRSREDIQATKDTEAAALQARKAADAQKMKDAEAAAAKLEADRKAAAEAAKAAGKVKGTRAPPEPKDPVSEVSPDMEAVASAEDVILNDARTRRTLLTQAELDAGVDLTVLSTNSDPAVAKAALDVIELNLPAPQYAELVAYVERVNNHESLGGNRTDADFAAKELQTMVTMFNSGAVPDNSVLAFDARFKELATRVRNDNRNADVLSYAQGNNLPNKKRGKIGGAFSLASLADVVLGNGKRAVPLAIGKQRMIARNILNKFKVKPELSVFASQADMKQRNPALYKRAAAARSQGDFDSAPAVGYFFDNQVIIFSDRVATRQQLEFVVAHEVLGHFGMRSVLGTSEFNTLMESFYNDSVPYMKIAVDDMVAARGIPRAEAVEEYLSDFAARVEMSVLRRWWAKVKDALNKIGFKFDDDAARYLMNQSRRYLRTGENGSVFDTDRVAASMHQLDAGTDPTGVGRFSTAAEHITVRSVGHTVDDPGRLMPSSIQDAQDKFTRAAEVLGFAPKDLADKYDALKRNLVTPAIFRGMRSEGLQKVYENLTRATNTARSLVTRMQTMRDIALNPRAERLAAIGMGGSGISLDERAKAGYVLKANRMYHSHNYRMPSMRNLPKLFLRNAATGKLELQDGPNGAFTKLLKGNRLSREQWTEGVRVPYDTQMTMTDAKRAELEAARDAAIAAATTDKAKNRITRDYKARIEANTYTGVAYLDVKQEFTDLEWGAFNQELDAMGYTAVELLESILTKHDQERTNSYRRVDKQLDAAMTDGDRALLDRVARRYVEIQDANLTILEGGQVDPSSRDTVAAEKFLIQFNAALLGTGRDRIYNLFAPNADNDGIVAFPDSERQALTDMIDGFLTRYKPPAADSNAVESIEKRRVVQREVGLVAGQLSASHDAEKAAVRSLQTGYVPIVRTGTHQASMVFTGADGKKYTLGESYREQAPYMQYESRSDADRAAEELTTLFGDKEFTVEVWDPEADNGRGKLVMKKGKLSGVSSVALDAPTTDPEISHDAALRFIRRFNIPLTPQKLEEIVKASTTSGNRAILRQLKTGFTPGAPNDLTSAISSHIESRAATIARNKTSVELENILDIKGDSAELWTGSKKRYDDLKAEYERLKAAPNPNEDAISVARQKFEQYHRWYVTENAPSDGNKFYAEARSMVAFRDQQKGVLETDLANNKHIAMVQMLTSVSYLGFMMASGALNVISGFVNSPAALGTVNHETGFGGGFGMVPAYAAMVRMTKVAAGLGGQKDTAEYWQKLTPAQLKEMGIEPETRDFIAVGINSGILQAAQTNSLMGSARGRITSGGAQKFLTVYMSPFNWTEQVGRRTTALAGFELMFQRHLAAGKSRAEAAEAASGFATQMVLSTLGGYTAIDRPALFRGGPLQFAFMFSMFTVNTAALIANLPRAGQIALLGSILLLSGLRGVPYAEDIEDLVNTLAQKFGIPMPSVRDSLRRAGDELIPGFGEMLISGAANRFLPYDVGSRFSSGDIIPGSGIGLAGADVSRELISIGGPMASWTQQMIGTIGNVADILPGGKAFSVEKTLRESPVAFVRAVTDAYAFDKHGAVVDKRGYVVSEDYNAAVGLGRILGLQPSTTSAAYGAIREAKLITEYQKSMSVYYRDRIVAATVAGDNAKVQALYAEAREWNESAEGTGLEVINLRSRVRSALRSQRLGASERFLKTTPLATRSAAQQIVDAYIAE